jgi:hypothetical protein
MKGQLIHKAVGVVNTGVWSPDQLNPPKVGASFLVLCIYWSSREKASLFESRYGVVGTASEVSSELGSFLIMSWAEE